MSCGTSPYDDAPLEIFYLFFLVHCNCSACVCVCSGGGSHEVKKRRGIAMVHVFPVEFAVAASASAGSEEEDVRCCSVEEALQLLKDSSFAAPLRVIVPANSSKLGELRALLDALQDRNGGRTSTSKGEYAFRAVYKFPPPEMQSAGGVATAIERTKPERLKSSEATHEDVEGHLSSGFGHQSVADQQRMLSGMFEATSAHSETATGADGNEQESSPSIHRVCLQEIRVPASKKNKTPHNQRAQLYMWQVVRDEYF